MSGSEDYIKTADWLLKNNLSRSAKRLLDEARRKFGDSIFSPDNNPGIAAIEEAARRRPTIDNRIFALTVFEGVGIVVPLIAEEGVQRDSWCDQEASQAWQRARTLVRGKKIFAENVPSKQVAMPDPRLPSPIKLVGASIGLPAALAIQARLGKKPPRPVLATGYLDNEERVRSVGEMQSKMDIAKKEIEDIDGIILVPPDSGFSDDKIREVRDLDEAIEVAFGESPAKPAGKPEMKPRRRSKAGLSIITAILTIVFCVVAAIIIAKLLSNPEPPLGEQATGENGLPELQPQPQPQLQPPGQTQPFMAESGTEVIKTVFEFYRVASINDREKYWSMFTDPLECYYNRSGRTLAEVKEARQNTDLSNMSPYHTVYQFVELTSDQAVVSLRKKSELPTSANTHGHILIMKKINGTWKVAGEASPSKHDCLIPSDTYDRPADPDGWLNLHY